MDWMAQPRINERVALDRLKIESFEANGVGLRLA